MNGRDTQKRPAVVTRLDAELECDEWSTWLLEHRHGGSPALKGVVRAAVDAYVDRVLDAARLDAGMTLADIGTGDGAVALRAIERVGPGLRVLLADISAPLLRHVEAVASERGVQGQCTFMQISADKLDGIGSDCVDAVCTRAVLAYVTDKRAALREFWRILKPGGRVSIAEPLMQDDALETIALKRMADERGGLPGHELLPLLHRWKAAQFPDSLEELANNPIANYSERDMLGYFQECGFVDIHLELHIDLRRQEGMPWETFLRGSPHPWAAPHGVIFETQFNAAERDLLEAAIRPSLEAGIGVAADRNLYVSAIKPIDGTRPQGHSGRNGIATNT